MRRVSIAASVLLLAVGASGCAATERGLEDAAVVATFPLHVLATPASLFSDAWEEDPGAAAGRAPVLIPLYVLGDALFTGFSAVDLALTPAYAPFRVERLRFYRLDRFPPVLRQEAAADAGRATGVTVVFLAPIGAFFLVVTGRPGDFRTPPDPNPNAPPRRP